MSMEEIREDFPLLTDENHARTSDDEFTYNCFAFALGDTSNWWEPPGQFGYYWPPGFPADCTVDTAVKIIKLHGYTLDLDRHSTPNTEAIAIYSDDNIEWSHFAKFTSGRWVSKIGEDHDISHASLDLLEGPFYGKVVRVLSRPIQ
jgi:hypothetical protein